MPVSVERPSVRSVRHRGRARDVEAVCRSSKTWFVRPRTAPLVHRPRSRSAPRSPVSVAEVGPPSARFEGSEGSERNGEAVAQAARPNTGPQKARPESEHLKPDAVARNVSNAASRAALDVNVSARTSAARRGRWTAAASPERSWPELGLGWAAATGASEPAQAPRAAGAVHPATQIELSTGSMVVSPLQPSGLQLPGELQMSHACSVTSPLQSGSGAPHPQSHASPSLK